MTSDLARVQNFLSRYADVISPREREVGEAWWKLATTGTEDAQRELVGAGLAYNEVFTSDEDFETLRDLYENRDLLDLPGSVVRQIEVLYLTFAGCRGDSKTLERIENLEAKANAIYGNYRGEVRGEKLSENGVRSVLEGSDDEELRREAWEASKTVGSEVEDTVRELARLRNSVAREQGYRDHYHRALALQEIDPGELEEIMSGLQSATDEPFRELKDEIDDHLRRKFGVEEVMPWHLSNPFFQSCKQEVGEMYDPDARLDSQFAGKDLEELTRRTYDSLGLEVRDVFARSDLYEREGKDQHAFCIHIGRDHPYDVRVLANVRADHYWMDTLLHEFGHAVYDKHHDPYMPYFLRTVAHTNTTEAIALMMGSLADDPVWLRDVAGVPEGDTQTAWRMNRLDKLVFIRWAIVMYRFEQALYGDPDRDDLNDVWWDLVEEVQLVTRPEGRDTPDWAAKIHVANVPVYYHNYVIGELIATQLRAYVEENITHGPFFQNEQGGRYLVEAIFGPGARENWRDTVERATGEKLNPDRFIASLA